MLRSVALCLVLVCTAIYTLAWLSSAAAVAPLSAADCAPLSVVDRYGRALRELPAACGPAGRGPWVALEQLPPLVLTMLIASEDARFEQHFGVDPRAVVRAALSNLRAGKRKSGASTITMQLARLLHPSARARSVTGKLEQTWLALSLERRLSKREILEAYVNLAYYGAGAYGIAAAAQTYYAKPLAALSDGESSLLAVLPRAPSAYDPRHQLARAQQRRAQVLARTVALGWLAPAQRDVIAAEPLAIATTRRTPANHAGHFTDWVVSQLAERERRRGGTLETTLDLELQRQVEAAVREHVASQAEQGVTEAGVVVLDADSGAVRALVGSRDYASSQLNIVTRRRQLGSLLKPYVYALALEAGEKPSSLALDIGDATEQYRARDWVGREAGPLTQREALAGSYNLAAVNVLERVGVPVLHARLRRAGVAELPSAPARYGLALALGAANVRLLDVAAGYGFLVRQGAVRRTYGSERLEHPAGGSWRPAPTPETRVFSPAVSWQVMDVLSDDAARHRRFGRGLPVEDLGAARVVAKTGTASGMSDFSAILACREFIVAAWAGRFDGRSTRNTSGMWTAAPLARRALAAALRGRTPSLPPRPAELDAAAVARVTEPIQTLPTELQPWAERARVLSNMPVHPAR